MTKKNPTEGLSMNAIDQIFKRMEHIASKSEILAVEQMKIKDMDDRQSKIYDRFRYETWVARGKKPLIAKKNPKAEKMPTPMTETMIRAMNDMIFSAGGSY